MQNPSQLSPQKPKSIRTKKIKRMLFLIRMFLCGGIAGISFLGTYRQLVKPEMTMGAYTEWWAACIGGIISLWLILGYQIEEIQED